MNNHRPPNLVLQIIHIQNLDNILLCHHTKYIPFHIIDLSEDVKQKILLNYLLSSNNNNPIVLYL